MRPQCQNVHLKVKGWAPDALSGIPCLSSERVHMQLMMEMQWSLRSGGGEKEKEAPGTAGC